MGPPRPGHLRGQPLTRASFSLSLETALFQVVCGELQYFDNYRGGLGFTLLEFCSILSASKMKKSCGRGGQIERKEIRGDGIPRGARKHPRRVLCELPGQGQPLSRCVPEGGSSVTWGLVRSVGAWAPSQNQELRVFSSPLSAPGAEGRPSGGRGPCQCRVGVWLFRSPRTKSHV